MAKYNTAYAVLLNNGEKQILPVSKAQLIELASSQSQGQFGEGAKDVAAALTYLLNKSNTDLEAAKTYTTNAINDLDSSQQAQQGYVLTSITQADGKLTAYTESWLDASVVSYQGVGENAPTTVQGAIEDIQETLAGLAGDGEGSVQTQIENALGALDLAQVSETGKPITYVSQTDGQVAAGTGNIKAQYVDVDNTTLQWDLDGTTGVDSDITVQSAIEHLQDEIDDAVGAAAKYTVNKITTDLPSTVGVRYQLMESINGGTATAVAQNIDIPADSTLVEVYLGADSDTVNATTGVVTKNTVDDPQSMNFVHKLADGTYSITKIDVSKFFTQSERGNGLVKTGATLAVGLDSESESFLSVESDGIKLSGVQNAINAAETAAKTYTGTSIEALDSEIAAKTENGFSYVMTGVTEADGKLTAATYISLDDSTVKTTPFTGEDLATLLGTDIQNVTNIHDALNKIAGKVNNTQAGAVNNIVITDGSYIKAINESKDGNNTYSFTIDDSALGNVSKLQYDELTWNEAETITILGANPNE